jgi:hypothetical protein
VPPFAELIVELQVHQGPNQVRPIIRLACRYGAIPARLPDNLTRSDASPGRLSANAAPFAPTGSGQLNRDMRLGLPLNRLSDRRALLASLDRLNRQMDTTGAMADLDSFNSRAVQLLPIEAVFSG